MCPSPPIPIRPSPVPFLLPILLTPSVISTFSQPSSFCIPLSPFYSKNHSPLFIPHFLFTFLTLLSLSVFALQHLPPITSRSPYSSIHPPLLSPHESLLQAHVVIKLLVRMATAPSSVSASPSISLSIFIIAYSPRPTSHTESPCDYICLSVYIERSTEALYEYTENNLCVVLCWQD